MKIPAWQLIPGHVLRSGRVVSVTRFRSARGLNRVSFRAKNGSGNVRADSLVDVQAPPCGNPPIRGRP